MYASNMYYIPPYDCTGNRPNRLVYIVLLFMSPMTATQYTELLMVVHICSGRFMASTARHVSTISLCWILDDCTPCRVLTMCPLSVAVACGRYLLINLCVRPGNNLAGCKLITGALSLLASTSFGDGTLPALPCL